MTITALPTPPSRGQSPTTFSSDADTFLNALPTMVTQINATTANMDTQYEYVYSNVSTTATQAAQATSAANSAVTARNQIEVLFLGSKASNPTTNNQGGALIVGCKYFNTTVGEDRVWTGTGWVSSTAIGGTVAGLNVDGLFKLKANLWHVDSFDSQRLYLENDGTGNSQRTILRGNEFNFWNSAGTGVFKVVSNGGMFTTGQASLNANGAFLSAHSVTVGTTNGGNNSIGLGVAPGGNGGWGTIGADSTHSYVGTNTYYAAGADRFSVNGYAPKIRLFTTDNSILFQQTDNGVAGNSQVIHTIANFDNGGVLVVNSRNGYGSVGITGGGPSHAGFVSFQRPAGERTGYIGYTNDVANSNNLIVSDNGHPWRFTGGGVAPQSDSDAVNGVDLVRLSQFASTQTTNGYTKLPNGLILQWGTVSLPTDTTNTVSLNVAFPNNNFAAWTTMQGGGLPTRNSTSVSGKSLTNLTIIMNGNGQSVYWMAIGN